MSQISERSFKNLVIRHQFFESAMFFFEEVLGSNMPGSAKALLVTTEQQLHAGNILEGITCEAFERLKVSHVYADILTLKDGQVVLEAIVKASSKAFASIRYCLINMNSALSLPLARTLAFARTLSHTLSPFSVSLSLALSLFRADVKQYQSCLSCCRPALRSLRRFQ